MRAEEDGVVLSGRVEVAAGDQCKMLEPGDACLFESRKPHRFRQVGSQDAVVISACTPPPF